ncbi:early endosome antigen 1-like [Strongylocentrotus purpuratus]|uniref:FYVE-type domain-containing protein n=1 Tax=Strongylocentrotus purpuratus TaxID=7668 RepID=A0A7M7N0N0_STRPU|nr:early endosome antigen 1-like [Strongylocentrotus purpuratus]
MTVVNERVNNLQESLDSRNTVLQDKEQLVKQQVEQHAQEKTKFTEEMTNKLNSEQAKVTELTNALDTTQMQLVEAKAGLAEKTQSELVLTDRVSELEASRISLHAELTAEQQETAHLKKQTELQDGSLAESFSKCEMLEQQIVTRDNVQRDMQQKIEVLEKDLAKECQLCKNYEVQVVKLESKIKELGDKSSALKTEVESLHASLTKTEEDLEVVRGSEASLMCSVKGLQEINSSLEGKMSTLERSLQDKERSFNEEKATLTSCIEQERTTASELRESRDGFQSELEQTKGLLQTEKTERAKEVSSLQDARQLLITQKLELQSQLTEKDNGLSAALADHEETKEVSKKVQNMLREESAALQSKLASETQAKVEAEEERERQEQRYNMQLSALNENLGTLRSDMMQADTRSRELEKTVEDFQGEKHVMEATIQNSQDERRALLERCLSNEKDVEKLQAKTAELRRKLDDAQAAMHELGRENQALQITQTKAMGRKWTDDKEVLDCMSCSKAFSLAVRKHHCRNCGDIFCQECSSKNTMIASAKKPVRVCDACYVELKK